MTPEASDIEEQEPLAGNPVEESICEWEGYGDTFYTTLNVETSQIRLLCFSNDEDRCCSEEFLCCNLCKASLDDDLIYAALSYCWGDVENTVEICLAGRRIPVTVNLASALRRLRDMPYGFFWADAVCVNQNDLEERGEQVQLMQDVYSGAEMVYTYLHESIITSDDASPEGYSTHTDEVETGQEIRDRVLINRWNLYQPSHNKPELDGRGFPRRFSTSGPFPSHRHYATAMTSSIVVVALDLAVESTRLIEQNIRERATTDVDEGLQLDDYDAAPLPEPIEIPESLHIPPNLASNDVDLGLFWCNTIYEQLMDTAGACEEASAWHPEHELPYVQDHMPVLVNDAIRPVLHLMRHQYWSRVWTFQEMVLADEQVFLGPSTEITRTRFESVCSWLQEVADGKILRPKFVEHTLWPQLKDEIQETNLEPLKLRRCRELAIKIDESDSEAALFNLRNKLFKHTAHRQARDPRDHIYGVLAVLGLRWRPRYDYAVRDVYWLYARSRTKSKHWHNFDFLSRAGIGQNNIEKYELPSWLPDWSSPTNCGYYTTGVRASDGLAGKFLFGKTALSLVGVVVGTVAPRRRRGLGMLFQMYHYLLSHGHPTGDPPLQVLYRIVTQDTHPACIKGKYDAHNPGLLRAFVDFTELVLSSDDTAYFLMEKDDALFNVGTFALNNYFGLEPGAGDRWNVMKYVWEGCEPSELTTGDKVIDDNMELYISISSPIFENLGDRQGALRGRIDSTALFRTDNGYVGGSGPSVREGDLLCILAACPTPLVLRKRDDHYIIVEPCFVHGLMYGEVMQLIAKGKFPPQQTFEIR
ncbi:hypothetical protein LTS10_011457 [Elasticomyces elasticus]|nr:hypothetical protein LTS10_011457 [Elasticomyces elasticus]